MHTDLLFMTSCIQSATVLKIILVVLFSLTDILEVLLVQVLGKEAKVSPLRNVKTGLKFGQSFFLSRRKKG